jgi:hypothetical protein
MASTTEMPDGSVEVGIFSEDRTRKLTFTAYVPDEETSVWEHQLWPDEFGKGDASAPVNFLGRAEA